MKVVIIGGGTGLSRLIRGFKYIEDISISAIVTISDDGGSTGVLSRHFSIPAVGDIRRVIGAMSTNRESLERTLEFRFKNTNSALDGHSLGNIIILSEILRTGSFAQGIIGTSQMLNTEGQIIPIANYQNELFAEFEDGSVASGESSFHTNGSTIKKIFFKDKNLHANNEAIEAIINADFIVLGIGSLYTSILPNLIYKNVIEALKATNGKIIYFGNITTEIGETDNMTLMNHIQAIEDHTFVNIIDYVIVNSTIIPKQIEQKYEEEGQHIIDNSISNANFKVFKSDLLSFENDVIRHDPDLVKITFENLLKKYDIYTKH